MTHTHYHHHTGQLVQEGNNVANWLKGRIESDSGGKISRITSTHTHTNNPKTQQRHTNSQWPNNTNEHTWSLVHTHVTQPHRDTLNTETSIYFHVPVYLAWFTQTSLSLSANFSSFIVIAQVYCSTSKDGESSLKTGLKLCWSAVTSWLIQCSGDIARFIKMGTVVPEQLRRNAAQRLTI